MKDTRKRKINTAWFNFYETLEKYKVISRDRTQISSYIRSHQGMGGIKKVHEETLGVDGYICYLVCWNDFTKENINENLCLPRLYTGIFIADLSVIAPKLETTQEFFSEWMIKQTWCIHTMEKYLVMNRNKL